MVLTGNNLKAKFKMAQTEWDQWNAAIPETSSYDGAAAADRADFGADAGYSLAPRCRLAGYSPDEKRR
jgi:hypothetical protein